MERRVKERLVGASILVVLVVLIVPELLSGPKQSPAPVAAPSAGPAEVHTVSVDMTTSKATPTEDGSAASAPLPADASSMPVAGAAAADAPDPASGPPAATPPPATSPSIATLQAQTPVPDPVENNSSPPRTSSAGHNWLVQLGSFASRVNAEKLQRNLKAKGFAASVSPGGSGKAARYRVRVGPVADRAGAEKLVARLRKEGHAASVVAP